MTKLKAKSLKSDIRALSLALASFGVVMGTVPATAGSTPDGAMDAANADSARKADAFLKRTQNGASSARQSDGFLKIEINKNSTQRQACCIQKIPSTEKGLPEKAVSE